MWGISVETQILLTVISCIKAANGGNIPSECYQLLVSLGGSLAVEYTAKNIRKEFLELSTRSHLPRDCLYLSYLILITLTPPG